MAAEQPFAELMRHLRENDPASAEAVFDRYAQRLVRLAASRLPVEVRAKDDADDVVQSVFVSFFRRHAAGQFTDLDGWDRLWSLLTVLTVRKCGHRLERFFAARRDVRRERPAAP